MKLLMENWRLYCEEDFVVLCESYEQGIITEERLLMLWEDSVDRKYQQLLNEGIMDILAVGYEKGKQLAGKAKAVYDNAVSKVSNFYMDLLNQVWLLTQKIKQGLGKLASVLKSVYNKVSAFCELHPIICNATKILIVMFAIAGAALFFSSSLREALASAVKNIPTDALTGDLKVQSMTTPGKVINLNDAGIDALKGVLSLGADPKVDSPELNQLYADAYKFLEQAHASKEVIELAQATDKGANVVQGAFEILNKTLDAGDATFQEFVNLGKNAELITVKSSTTVSTLTAENSGFAKSVIEFQSVVSP
tara:strand:+ start:1827 stop:2750 length:924 start_codon:yes stop_codon:yes gene_type:complete